MFTRICVAVLCSLILFGSSSVFAEGGWMTVGPVYRDGMKVGTSGTGDPADVGDAANYADRTYDDGYVNQDPGTGNPASPDPNTTWFWGYDNGGQYDSGAETLSFHKAGTITDDSMEGHGVEIIFGVPLIETAIEITEEVIGMDLCFGLQILSAQSATDAGGITDIYDTTGTVIPGAPHRGTYDGPFDTPPASGVLIPNLPTERIQTALSVNAEIFELWVGPKLYTKPIEQLMLYITPKISANYVSVDVSRSAALQDAGYSDGDDSRFMIGAGAVGGLDVELGGGAFLGVWGGYEWVENEVNVHLKPAGTVSVDVSGYSAGAALGIRFD